MKLNVELKEVMRYLSYRSKQTLTDDMTVLIEDVIEEAQILQDGRYCFHEFPTTVDEGSECVHVMSTSLELTGHSITRHLLGAKKVSLLAATLGLPIEQAIKKYSYTDLTRSLILDAVANDMIEKVCDIASCEIDALAKEQGMGTNMRFSPGYGDLPLDIQREFLATLNAERLLGLTVNANHIMIPRKSVTAIIGIFDTGHAKIRPVNQPECDDCTMTETCQMKVEDEE